MATLTRKITVNTIIQFIAKAAGIGINLVVAYLLLNYLEPTGMGQYTSVLALLQIFLVVLELGLNPVILKELGLATTRVAESRLINSAITIKIISSIVYVLIAYGVSFAFGAFSGIERTAVLVVSFSFVFWSFSQTINLIFQKHLQTKWPAITDVIGKVALLAFTYVVMLQGRGLVWVMAAMVFANLLSLILNIVFSKKFIDLGLAWNAKLNRKLIRAGWPLTLGSAVSLVYFKADVLILNHFRPSEEVGWYGAVYRINEIIAALPPLIIGLVVPKLSAAYKKKDTAWTRNVIGRILSLFFVITIPLILVVQVMAEPILIFIGNAEYLPAVPLLKIIIIASGALFFSSFFIQLIIIFNRQKTLLWAKIFIAATALAGYFLFIPEYGAMAAAIISVYAEVLLLILAWLIIKKSVNVPLLTKSALFAILLGLLVAALTYLAGYISSNFLFLALVAILAYISGFFIMKFWKRLELIKIFTGALLIGALLVPLISQPAEAKSAEYPRTANVFHKWSIEDDEIEDLAKYDVLILDVENNYHNPEKLEKLKEHNPDLVLLGYISLSDIRPDAAELNDKLMRGKIGRKIDDQPDWLLRDSWGNPIEWWPDYYIFNVTKYCADDDGQRYNEYLPEIVADTLATNPVWDGVFYDTLWDGAYWLPNGKNIDLNQDGVADSKKTINKSWRKGTKNIIKRTRKRARQYNSDFIVTGNGRDRYAKYTNGILLEDWPKTYYGDWSDNVWGYYEILNEIRGNPLAMTNTSGKKKNYRKFRYGLTSTLLGNGYYSYDRGGTGGHTKTWWYDEYNVALGKPLGPAYNVLDISNPKKIQKGVWRRDYENGIVILNSTKKKKKVNLETGYEKITGTQDLDVNNGKNVGQVKIKKRDGIILLGRITEIQNAPYINGAYAKAFNSRGKKKRNSFFNYNPNYPGGAQVIKLKKKTIVARKTWVTIYNKKGKEVSRFAPFGEGFDGQINIDVGYLYKKKKKGKTLVVGSRDSGGMIRQYNLKGDLIHPGCFPYGEGFNGGINVAVGDVVGGKSGEIVVAPRSSGGPHVKVLSRACYDRTPGFMAYDPNMRSGVSVAVGNVTGDYKEEIVTGPGIGATPFIKVFNGDGQLLKPGFFAYNESDTSGVYVTVANMDRTNKEEIITNSFGIFD